MTQANQRLFIAIALPPVLHEPVARIRDTLHTQLGGRCVADTNLHLTLAFLGDTPPARIPVLQELLSLQPPADATLQLDRIGHFGAGEKVVVWLGSSTPPDALLAHESRLRSALQAAGFPVEARPYQPHLTLLRDARRWQSRLAPPLQWSLGPVQLFSSTPGKNGPIYTAIAAKR
ncbi:RNA 2',3'-cyclic phosphodiesterase [Chitinilyticum aquatile]|uniref:RNA 2',3'-cyclic phosphodiesterase n=1 Tax=Chitinilyticum aquatile TaxID=362520 RepID=UPI00041B1B41|nr:RNA 2',3'-cyclic phosphodiesterase [Chitinilyticum aquatile]